MPNNLQTNRRAHRDRPGAGRSSAGRPMRCHGCGDVIGYYEPLVLLESSGPRETSGAAEPEIRAAPGVRFHRGCYAGAASIDPPVG